jgi:hypothetical protein
MRAKVVERLPSKHKVLSSNPSTTKKEKEKEVSVDKSFEVFG